MGGMMMPEMLDWEKIKDAVNAARVDKYPDYKDNPMGCQPIPHWDLIERIVEQQVALLVSDKEPKPPDSSTGGFANELELAAWEAASDEALERTEADG
jgi:hypothetical protein